MAPFLYPLVWVVESKCVREQKHPAELLEVRESDKTFLVRWKYSGEVSSVPQHAVSYGLPPRRRPRRSESKGSNSALKRKECEDSSPKKETKTKKEIQLASSSISAGSDSEQSLKRKECKDSSLKEQTNTKKEPQLASPSISAGSNSEQSVQRKEYKDSSPKGETKTKKEIQLASSSISALAHPAHNEPNVHFVAATLQKKEQGQKWLEKARPEIQSQKKSLEQAMKHAGRRTRRTSTQEHYSERVNGMPPPHIYQNTPFCVKGLLPDDCRYIKPLGDAEFKTRLEDCIDFDTFLDMEATEACNAIRNLPQFQWAAIRSMPKEEQVSWNRELVTSDKNIEQLLQSKKTVLKDPFKYTFRAISFHEQTEGTDTEVSAYYSHKDKVGNLVCFHQLAGVSYNFVAMESDEERTSNEKEKAALVADCGGCKLYQEYKALVSHCEKIEKFEADFMKKATLLELPRVYIFQLNAGDKLIFTARDYLHGTIIPKQQDGIRRALLVFHDLIPYESFVY